MLSDVSAFLVSIFAAWAATQPSSWHYSFGYHRAEILGALVSVLTIWAVTGALVFEAVQRTINPVRVDGKREWGGRCWTWWQCAPAMMYAQAAGVECSQSVCMTEP
jgi:divalent metal cation (Fe/Co/Zn/Cd) transporter